MKSIPIIIVLSSILPTLHAHWVYPIVSVNGGPKSSRWQYVRKLGPAPFPYGRPDDPSRGQPNRDIYSDEIRCGRGAFASANETETLALNAGDSVLFEAHETQRTNNWTTQMYHPGAAQIYLSKSPTDDLASYAGDGDWFKIQNIGTTDGKTWDLWEKENVTVTIPKATPPGKYLLKTEYIAYHQGPAVYGYEFYLACAHVDIKGDGRGTPGPMVKFPGAYDMFDRGIWRPISMGYSGKKPGDNFRNIGPDVWTG